MGTLPGLEQTTIAPISSNCKLHPETRHTMTMNGGRLALRYRGPVLPTASRDAVLHDLVRATMSLRRAVFEKAARAIKFSTRLPADLLEWIAATRLVTAGPTR